MNANARSEQTFFVCPVSKDRLVGLVVKASASRAEGPGFESRLRRDLFRGRVIPVTSKLALQLATLPGAWRCRVSTGCQYTVTGWGRTFDPQLLSQCGSTVKLSEQIRPWDTLACCWDVKQPTNKQCLQSNNTGQKGLGYLCLPLFSQTGQPERLSPFSTR